MSMLEVSGLKKIYQTRFGGKQSRSSQKCEFHC